MYPLEEVDLILLSVLFNLFVLSMDFHGIRLLTLILGLLIFSFGTSLIIWAYKYLKWNIFSPILPFSNKVVKKGPYGIVRHPAYVGLIIAFYGLGIVFNSRFSLAITTFILIPIIFYQAKEEEKELIKKFGEDYIKYVKEVPMFLPKIFFKSKSNE
jgi:protein-S-isoprenylcysteine O-methyltransferase Ste14